MHSHFHILTCSLVLSLVLVSHCCHAHSRNSGPILLISLHVCCTDMPSYIMPTCEPPERHTFFHSPWVTVQLEQYLIRKSLSPPHFHLLLNSFATPVHPWPQPIPTRPLLHCPSQPITLLSTCYPLG